MKKIQEFLKTKVWIIDEASVSKRFYFFIRQLRIILIATQGFVKDRCSEKASALTYYSLLSIVPVLAMTFGIAKGFGFQERLEEMLYEKFADQTEILTQAFMFANQYLENTRGGLVAGIGIIMLFYAVVKVLSNIEKSFNEIWEVKSQRPPVRMLSDYFAIMLLTPVLFIVSNSATIYISATINDLAQEIVFLQHFGILISFFLKILPFSLVWFMFALVYMIMPNTKVNFSSAFVGGVVAGIIFQIVQYIYIKFQVGVASYNAIYGSFAFLPLFLIWMQMNWLIVMLGAEISFAIQNIGKYEFEMNDQQMSHVLKVTVSIYLMRSIVKRFKAAQSPLFAVDLATELSLPVRMVRSLLVQLMEAGLLYEIKTESEKLFSYQPALDIHDITIHRVKYALEHHGMETLPTLQDGQLTDIWNKLQSFDDIADSTDENILLMDM